MLPAYPAALRTAFIDRRPGSHFPAPLNAVDGLTGIVSGLDVPAHQLGGEALHGEDLFASGVRDAGFVQERGNFILRVLSS
jgi:hypothetical protein